MRSRCARIALVVLLLVAVPTTALAAKKPPKVPTLSWTDNADGSYLLNWTNMKARYDVAVDGVLVATLKEPSYLFTAGGPGSYAIRVIDAKGVSVEDRLVVPGVLAEGANDHGQLDVAGWRDVVDVAAGLNHTVGAAADGTVFATGSNAYGQCDASGWSGITDVEAGWNHTLGRKADGSVVAAGRNDYGQTNVGGWTSVQKLAAGASFTVGLRTDGTVVATGRNQYGQCNVGGWTDIVDIACGSVHTLGLKSDGTVLYAGPTAGMIYFGQNRVGSWTGVNYGVSAGYATSLAWRNGAVLACGRNEAGQLNGVGDWSSITQLAGGFSSTVGLRSDGTALVAGMWWDPAIDDYTTFANVPTWSGLDRISAQGDFVVGLVR